MGNGQGLKPGPYISVDIETAPLDISAFENAVQAAASNFGKPNMIFMPTGVTLHHMGWHQFPEYAGLPWAWKDRLTKREHAFAKLHMFLYKLQVLKKLSEDDHESIQKVTIKRLKRAKWAANSGCAKPESK